MINYGYGRTYSLTLMSKGNNKMKDLTRKSKEKYYSPIHSEINLDIPTKRLESYMWYLFFYRNNPDIYHGIQSILFSAMNALGNHKHLHDTYGMKTIEEMVISLLIYGDCFIDNDGHAHNPQETKIHSDTKCFYKSHEKNNDIFDEKDKLSHFSISSLPGKLSGESFIHPYLISLVAMDKFSNGLTLAPEETKLPGSERHVSNTVYSNAKKTLENIALLNHEEIAISIIEKIYNGTKNLKN